MKTKYFKCNKKITSNTSSTHLHFNSTQKQLHLDAILKNALRNEVTPLPIVEGRVGEGVARVRAGVGHTSWIPLDRDSQRRCDTLRQSALVHSAGSATLKTARR